jgi:hypothetical protein
MVLEARERQAARVLGEDPSPLRGAPGFALGADAPEVEMPRSNGSGAMEPMRVHGNPAWKRIHPKVAIATGLAAFAIAVAALTLPELIFGGAVATRHRTTFFGGGQTTSKPQTTKTTTTTTGTGTATGTSTGTAPKTVTETVPATTPTTTQTGTTTTPSGTGTGTQTAPSGGAPAPTDTSTSPGPAPPVP